MKNRNTFRVMMIFLNAKYENSILKGQYIIKLAHPWAFKHKKTINNTISKFHFEELLIS